MRKVSISMSLLSLLLVLHVLQLLPASFSQATDTTLDDPTSNPVLVDDYLSNLSDDELRRICTDRGFDIVAPDAHDSEVEVVPTREELLEGARRCLTLEDEMNAILAEHPELAAELDKEIERMRRQKELLEKEREEMLLQKALLERQLRDAGIDVGSNPNSTAAVTTYNAVPDTLEGVLKESFVQLYERVMQDVRMVQKLLQPVSRQVDQVWQLVWKYLKPVLGSLWVKIRDKFDELNRQRKESS